MPLIENLDTENTGEKESRAFRLRPLALKKLERICTYLDGQRSFAGESFRARVLQVTALLIEMPLLGRLARSPRMLRKGYRSFVVDGYSLFYKVADREIVLYDIVHTARRPPDPDPDPSIRLRPGLRTRPQPP